MLVSKVMGAPIAAALGSLRGATANRGPVAAVAIGTLGGTAAGMSVYGVSTLLRQRGRGADRPELGFHQQLQEGTTPNGGVYSIASFYGANREPVDPDHSVYAEIVEYDSDDRAIHSTTLDVG